MHRAGVVVLLALCAGCGSSGSDPDAWREFTGTEGRFSVSMPGTPGEQKEMVPTIDGKLEQKTYALEKKGTNRLYGVNFADYPLGQPYDNPALAEKVLGEVRDGIVRGLKGTMQGTDKAIKLDAHLGKEFDVLMADRQHLLRVRLYLVGNRLYQLMAGWTKSRPPDAAETQKFLDSFQLKK